MKYTADFETTVDENDCRVWAWGLCEISDKYKFIYGNSIESFIDYFRKQSKSYTIYFHNLKFDGEFILSYLFRNNYTYIKDKKDRKSKTFTTLISDMGAFYSIVIYFDVYKTGSVKLEIRDSLKIINSSVDKIAKDFDLPCKKLEIDYKEKREIGHELTFEEVCYLKNDVEIMARALHIMFKEGLTKMTIGSDALNYYKGINEYFIKYFPILPKEFDAEIRKSYKGGFTYCNPLYKEIETKSGIVLDVNSMYPYILHDMYLPFGFPIKYNGKYEKDDLYPLFIQKISCSFILKENKIPTIQIKNDFNFNGNEYLTSSDGDVVILTLTNIDLELFFKNYDIKDLKYLGGYKFHKCKGLFSEYIDYWYGKKNQAKIEKNGSKKQIAKLMLNSLYGKFGLNPKTRSKIPYLDEDGIVKYNYSDEEYRDPIYIPIASFVTSYGRSIIINSSQAIRDYSINKYGKDLWTYNDTDSIHCLIDDESELKDVIPIDENLLGYFKVESRFKRGKYIRQKCYIEEDFEGELNVTVAGLPKKTGKYVTFENFNTDFTTENIKIPDEDKKLRYHHVRGGVILKETDFTIKK